MVPFRNPFKPDISGRRREQPLCYVLVDGILGPQFCVLIEDNLVSRQDDRVLQNAQRALSPRVEKADGLQLISEKLQSERSAVKGPIDVENSSPKTQIPVVLHERNPEKTALAQLANEFLGSKCFAGRQIIGIGDKHLRRYKPFDKRRGGGYHHEGRGSRSQRIERFDPLGCRFGFPERARLVARAGGQKPNPPLERLTAAGLRRFCEGAGFPLFPPPPEKKPIISANFSASLSVEAISTKTFRSRRIAMATR